MPHLPRDEPPPFFQRARPCERAIGFFLFSLSSFIFFFFFSRNLIYLFLPILFFSKETALETRRDETRRGETRSTMNPFTERTTWRRFPPRRVYFHRSNDTLFPASIISCTLLLSFPFLSLSLSLSLSSSSLRAPLGHVAKQ